MLFSLLETIVLLMNALAILNEKRFLKKCMPYLTLDGFDTTAVSNSPN